MIYSIDLNTPAFVILLMVLFLFLVMFIALVFSTSSKRARKAFLEATGVDMAFLGLSLLLLIYLAFHYPTGNHWAWAVTQVILRGYWLALAIPIVTVGDTVHEKTRGSIPWRGYSIAIALLLFLALLWYTYITS